MPDWKYRPKQQTDELTPEKNFPYGVKPEGFASKNVKVITFVVCISVFLLLFGPLTIFQIIDHAKSKQMGTKPMTVADVVLLSERGSALTMEELQQFEGSKSESGESVYYYVNVDRYLLLGVQNKKTKKLTFCTLTHEKSGDSVELLSGSEKVKTFLQEHGN